MCYVKKKGFNINSAIFIQCHGKAQLSKILMISYLLITFVIQSKTFRIRETR